LTERENDTVLMTVRLKTMKNQKWTANSAALMHISNSNKGLHSHMQASKYWRWQVSLQN